jgi:hypothetical protein
MAQTRAELMEDEETQKKTIADLDDIQCGRVTEARGMAPDQDTPHSRRCPPLFAHGLQQRVARERQVASIITANSTKTEIWLGDLDSNQGCPVQSRKFYR